MMRSHYLSEYDIRSFLYAVYIHVYIYIYEIAHGDFYRSIMSKKDCFEDITMHINELV